MAKKARHQVKKRRRSNTWETENRKRRQQAGRLLERERRFVEFYMGRCKGNATAAAKAAGYTKATAEHQATRLLGKVGIQRAIKARIDGDPLVAERKDLQQLWTGIAFARKPYAKARLKDRLRASELLGKSQAVFTIKHTLDVGQDLATLLGKPLPKYTVK